MTQYRFKMGKRLWQEDDATHMLPDHESREQAWLRLTGARFKHDAALVEVDHGDSTDYFFRVGEKVFLLSSSWPGEASIYEVEEVQ